MGLAQVLTTLLPLTALWVAVHHVSDDSLWWTVALTLAMSLLLLRVFVLLHECGHGSLFRTQKLNQGFGFLFGVLSGMPQYVWSEHHHYHHSTNGNWTKYRGPLAVASVSEFAAMTPEQQRSYQRSRSIWLAPFAGFLYLIFNPRVTWIKGTAGLLKHLAQGKLREPDRPLKALAQEYKTRYWETPRQYWHMTGNNVALLSSWVALAFVLDPVVFFSVYLISGSLAGGAGIVLFTVQHNFEHSYASDGSDWCYDTSAIHGTSFLVLPAWLNWITANIAYHHIHHLSARIPNYRLAACHEENQHLFTDVSRIPLSKIGKALDFVLWDTQARRLISIAEYRQASLAA